MHIIMSGDRCVCRQPWALLTGGREVKSLLVPSQSLDIRLSIASFDRQLLLAPLLNTPRDELVDKIDIPRMMIKKRADPKASPQPRFVTHSFVMDDLTLMVAEAPQSSHWLLSPETAPVKRPSPIVGRQLRLLCTFCLCARLVVLFWRESSEWG